MDVKQRKLIPNSRKIQLSICSSSKSLDEIAKGGHWQNFFCKNNWIVSMKKLDD